MAYMGRSPAHASSVPLVPNPATGSIFPQFYVVFDNYFAFVPGNEAELITSTTLPGLIFVVNQYFNIILIKNII